VTALPQRQPPHMKHDARDPLSPHVSRSSAPHQQSSGERVGVRGEPLGRALPTIAHRAKLEVFRRAIASLAWMALNLIARCNTRALSMGCDVVRGKRASKKLAPDPNPLPALALMQRATSCDTLGEGVRSRCARQCGRQMRACFISGDRGYSDCSRDLQIASSARSI